MTIDLPTSLSYEVVVLGAGVSGSVAAIAAARAGAKVLLVEEHGFPGGSLTAMGVGPMMSFHNGAGEQVVHGIPDEIISRLQARGASLGHIADSITYCSTVTPFESEELKIEFETMFAESGVDVLYHTQLAAVETTAAADAACVPQIRRVILCNKAGLSAVEAKVFIDASGDGDLAARAGVPFSQGRDKDGATQPMTMNLKLANVDMAKVRATAAADPDNFIWNPLGKEEGLRRLKETPRASLAGYLREWEAARARGEVDVPRDLVLFFETPTPGVVIVNTSRVIGLDPTDPFQLSRAEIIGRRQCAQIFEFLRKHAAGFENAVRMDTSAKIGVRESRHITTAYTITAEDLLRERHFEDTVALGGYPIDVHSPDAITTDSTHLRPEAIYQIPLRSLLVPMMSNLVIVGRCIGATHEAAAAFRVTPIAMAIGQAGGVAAAESIRLGTTALGVPADEVRKRLRLQDARL